MSELLFRRGDIVVLRSGGPGMTLVNAAADGGVDCCWFNHQDDVSEFKQVDGVREEALQKI